MTRNHTIAPHDPSRGLSALYHDDGTGAVVVRDGVVLLSDWVNGGCELTGAVRVSQIVAYHSFHDVLMVVLHLVNGELVGVAFDDDAGHDEREKFTSALDEALRDVTSG